jgi:DNA primase
MAGREELQELLDNLDVEAYLEIQGLDTKKGRSRKGVQLQLKECPFCGNDNWKVYLNAETGLGNCFVCNEGINRWKLIRGLQGYPPESKANIAETIQHIRQVSMDLGWRPKRPEMAVEEQTMLTIPNSIELPYDGKNLTYLRDRGITDDTTRYFHLRYCQMGWFPYQFGGEEKHQKWEERLIIPVYDLDGNMVTFQGRDIQGTADKKYLFPPGLPSTGRHLLNGHNARHAKTIVMGEGAFDVMAIKQALDRDPAARHAVPVGSFGKHLSMGAGEDQLEALLKLKAEGLQEIVFMWDAEPEALAAAVKVGHELQRYGLTTRLARLPPGKDPNEVSADVVLAAFFNAMHITSQMLLLAKLGKL